MPTSAGEEGAINLQFPRWIGVVCDDYERQREFYRSVLGLREINEDDDWVHYEFGPDRTFELLRRSTDPEYDHARYQVGFVVDDIEMAHRELVKRGRTDH